MRLVAYERNLDIVEAVFEQSDGTYWHVVKIALQGIVAPDQTPRLEYASLNAPPELGAERANYRDIPLPDTDPDYGETIWFQLIVRAMRSANGVVALALEFVL